MENLLESVADRMEMLVQKPSTRVQACQLLAKTKVVSWMVDILHPGSPRLIILKTENYGADTYKDQ